MREVCIDGRISNFPLSALHDGKNIMDLNLRKLRECDDFDAQSACPQLDALSIHICESYRMIAWAKRHISSLRSLKFCLKVKNDVPVLSELLQLCSDSLTSLELEFPSQRASSLPCLAVHKGFLISIVRTKIATWNVTSILSNLNHLKQLTVCVPIDAMLRIWNKHSGSPRGWIKSPIPVIILLLKSAPPIQLLIFHICISFVTTVPLTTLDWTFLSFFFSVPYPSFSRIVLRYSVTPVDMFFRPDFSLDDIHSSLSRSAEVMNLVREGLLVIERVENDEGL